MRENKAETLQKLVEAINTTSEGSEHDWREQITMSLQEDYQFECYIDGQPITIRYSEAVEIYIGERLIEVVNISYDSCMAMMRDVLKARCFN